MNVKAAGQPHPARNNPVREAAARTSRAPCQRRAFPARLQPAWKKTMSTIFGWV
jgi:hypothetical protein